MLYLKEVYIKDLDWFEHVCVFCYRRYFFVISIDHEKAIELLKKTGWMFHSRAKCIRRIGFLTPLTGGRYCWTEKKGDKPDFIYNDFEKFVQAAALSYIDRHNKADHRLEYGATEEWVDLRRKRLDDEIKILKNKKRKLK